MYTHYIQVVIHFLVLTIMKKIVDFAVFGLFAVALVIVFYIVMKRERFGVPEFLDRTMQDRTAASWHSSYEQKTNNLSSPDAHRAPVGQATGHRVGLFEAHTSPFAPLLE